MAQLAAQAAARAEGVVDLYFAAHHADSRTAKLQTHLAALAFIVCNLKRRIMLNIFKKCARLT